MNKDCKQKFMERFETACKKAASNILDEQVSYDPQYRGSFLVFDPKEARLECVVKTKPKSGAMFCLSIHTAQGDKMSFDEAYEFVKGVFGRTIIANARVDVPMDYHKEIETIEDAIEYYLDKYFFYD